MKSSWSRSRWVFGLAVVMLVAAACGSSSHSSSPTTTPSSSGSSAPTSAASSSCATPNTSLDSTLGTYAGWMQAVLNCTTSKPIKATGTPITVGFLNPQGDPNGSFPDVTAGAIAAVKYINTELGGLGGNPLTGTPGHPINLVTCYETISPSSSTSCANQVVAAKPAFIISGYQFFGSVVDPIFAAAGIPVINFNPITPADFQGQNIFDIAAGGGCVGVHPALDHFAVYTLHAKNIAIPWSNTAPGVPCYYDLEQKPIEVINGSLTPTPPGVTTVPGVTEKGYPIPPASPDDSSYASQILAQKPDAIIFSAQASDCFNLLNALSNLGWSAKTTPLIFSGACTSPTEIAQAGSKVDGVYFVGAAYNLLDPTSATGLISQEISTIDAKSKEYDPSVAMTGLTGAMFQTVMTTWLTLENNSAASSNPTASTIEAAIQNTSNVHMFAGLPYGCAQAPKNYGSVCSTAVSVQQWNGTSFTNVGQPFSATYLVNGTPLHDTATS